MTTGTIKSQGTKIFFALSATEIFEVACPTAISGLGGTANAIDKTCLSSVEMESERGMKSPAVINIPINFIPRSAAHQALQDLDESGETISWMITAPDAPPPTTVDSDGRLVSAGPLSVEYLGYVADFNYEIGTNDMWRGTISLQRVGAKVWDRPAADLP